MNIIEALQLVAELARGHKRTPTEEELKAIQMVDNFAEYLKNSSKEKGETA